jgi:putative nucleotidyltransferase with HDIG domain
VKLILTPKSGTGEAISFTLHPGSRVTVGRAQDSTICVTDPKLSRQHSAFIFDKGSIFLEDLKSTNGTFLNGVLITRAPLANGDQVAIGSFVYDLTIESSDRLVVPPPTAPRTALQPDLRIKFDLRASSLFTEKSATEQSATAVTRAGKDLSIIYRIGNLLNAEHDLERLFDLVLGLILDVVPAHRAFLLISEDGKRMTPRASRSKEIVQRPPDQAFSKTVANESFQKGLSILTHDALADSRFKDQKSVVDAKIRSVLCVPVQSSEKALGVIYLDTLGLALPLTRQDLELVSAVGLQAGTAIQRARLTEDLRFLFYDTVSALVAAVEAKDAYTKGHSERVAAIAVKLARHMTVTTDTVQTVHLGGLLHDIGKIGVAENVLNKPGTLTPVEWKIVYNHPEEGAKIVKKVRNMGEVVKAIRHHHEEWAGTGYPEGLKGDQIPLTARILSVADGFDAMTSPRSYRPAMSERQAIEELQKGSGQRYDPRIVDTFLDLHAKGGVDLRALYLFQGLKIERM